MTTDVPAVQHVGRFTLSVAPDDPTPETTATWAHRTEALAVWLLAEWHREQAAERN